MGDRDIPGYLPLVTFVAGVLCGMLFLFLGLYGINHGWL